MDSEDLVKSWKLSFDYLTQSEMQDQASASHILGAAQPLCVSGAKNDAQAIAWWLNSSKKNTLLNYRKTVFRFAAWFHATRKKPVSQMSFDDWVQYEHFLQTLPDSWCGRNPKTFGDFEGGYRYFKAKLAANSIVQEKRIVSSLFGWLSKTGYIHANPFLSDRRGEAEQSDEQGLDAFLGHSRKAIEPAAFEALRIFVECLDEPNEVQVAKKARLRFILDCLYYSGLRVSELCEMRTNPKRLLTISTGEPPPHNYTYSMIVFGKGRKYREVPMHQKSKRSYLEFRDSVSLPTGVKDYEDLPLLLDVNVKSIQSRKGFIKRLNPDKTFKDHVKLYPEMYQGIGRQAVYKILTKCYEDFQRWVLSDEGMQACAIDEAVAARLASQFEGKHVHSLRHSFGTNMVVKTGVEVTSKLMGHETPSTTMQYVSLGDSESYAAVSKID